MTFTEGLRSSNSAEWATPRALFDALNSEFHFTLDVASTDENTLCTDHYTAAQDGLAQEWPGAVWCNPPYGSQIGAWLRKASETKQGGVVVCLIPARTDTRWWHEYVTQASEVRFIRGRLKFGNSDKCAPFPSAIAIFDDRPRGYWRVCK